MCGTERKVLNLKIFFFFLCSILEVHQLQIIVSMMRTWRPEVKKEKEHKVIACEANTSVLWKAIVQTALFAT